MGGIHAGRPWREVVHIDSGVGVHGGAYWKLTLECGHPAFRRQPSARGDVLRAVSLRLFRLPFAPRRVRCLHCDTG